MKKNAWMFVVVLIVSGCGKKPDGPSGTAGVPATPQAPAVVMETRPAENFQVPETKKRSGVKYAPEGSPTRAIQDLDDMLDSYILDPKTPEEVKYNDSLKLVVLKGTFDIRELSRLALSKHWAERTPQEQDYFVDLMTRLLERKAIFSKEQGQKKAIKKKSKEVYQIVYNGDKTTNPEKTQALVISTVHVPTENLKIGLNYKVKQMQGGWKIYDVIVDGASLLDNYKYQFDRIIDKDGYPALVHRMESKLKDLLEKDKRE